ncbi:MAG: TonB-dependent receptor [Bacteroidales bacterium]|nr:TonB-dependent receptor [Bacteroidales bacterium]
MAQSQLSGTVKDEFGEPIMAVSVFVPGTNNFVTTDLDGNYTITVKSGDVLEFSFLGKKTYNTTYKGGARLNVVLYDDNTVLDDVVVVGYGTQKRQSITGAVSKVDGDKLLKAPTQNVSNMLGGVVPGVVAYQTSGAPGADGSSLIIRGSAPKYIVDGVERDFTSIDPSEIESISVLKDASAAAIYGLESEAVVIVTTKRGDNGASRVTYKGSVQVSQNATSLELLDGPGYAYWYNLGLEMDGLAPIFSQQHVDMMLNDDPSDGWGNTNWYEDVFGLGFNHTHNVTATGGNDKINYFASLGYYDQNGNVKGYGYDRINMRTNIEAKIAKSVTFNMGLSGRFTETDGTGFDTNPDSWHNIGQQILRAHPYVPKYYYGDNVSDGLYESYYGTVISTLTASNHVCPEGALKESGYTKSKSNIFEANASLRWDVPFVKGLSFKAMAAFDVWNVSSKSFATPFTTMVASAPTSLDGDISYVPSTDSRGASESGLTEELSRSEKWVTNLSVNYAREFGRHSLDFIALMETVAVDYNSFSAYGAGFDIVDLDELDFATNPDKQQKVAGSSSLSRTAGYVARLNYSYDNRYLVELSARYDGSYLYAGNNNSRWNLFPALSLGWRMDRERWFKSPIVDLFKLRVGLGQTGTSGVPAYSYLSTMGTSKNAVVIGGTSQSSLYTNVVPDKNVSWQKTFQTNVGADLSMWNGMLRAEVDVFYKYIYDLVVNAGGEYPASMGGYYPTYQNRDKRDAKGFEILLEHKNRIGDFSYNVTLVGSHWSSKWLSVVESENLPDWLKQTGTEWGSQVGFVALGLFQSQEEIDNSATIPGQVARPGDIKYKDINGDGVITYDQDRGYVAGSAYPKFTGGLTIGLGWKGIDFSMNWVTGIGRTVALTGVYSTGVMDNTAMTKPFYHGGNSPVYLVEESWREDNTDARFPRLTVNSPSNNNGFSSTWWYEDGSYLRLKSLQLGYSLPKKWMDKIGFGGIRVYFEGNNLLTFSKLMKYNIDPETPGVSNGYYPQQRLMGLGLEVTF